MAIKTLRKGSTGPEVRALQHALNARPYINLAEDGAFGARTEAAVKDFQRRVRITADGIVGPQTDALLWTRVVTADVAVTTPIQTQIAGVPVPLPTTQAIGQALLPTAPTGGGAGFIQQVSLGGQVSLAPWIVRPSPAPGTPSGNIWSGTVSYALVYRTASQGPHVELALNPQFAVNSRVQSSDPRLTLQVNGQVMFADLVAMDKLHLVSPFLQATALLNTVPGGSLGGGFAIGNQVSFDLIADRLQITLQFGLAAQWSNIGQPTASFAVLGQGAFGTTLQF